MAVIQRDGMPGPRHQAVTGPPVLIEARPEHNNRLCRLRPINLAIEIQEKTQTDANREKQDDHPDEHAHDPAQV